MRPVFIVPGLIALLVAVAAGVAWLGLNNPSANGPANPPTDPDDIPAGAALLDSQQRAIARALPSGLPHQVLADGLLTEEEYSEAAGVLAACIGDAGATFIDEPVIGGRGILMYTVDLEGRDPADRVVLGVQECERQWRVPMEIWNLSRAPSPAEMAVARGWLRSCMIENGAEGLPTDFEEGWITEGLPPGPREDMTAAERATLDAYEACLLPMQQQFNMPGFAG